MGLTPLIREAADRQTAALRQRREPEEALTEIAAQEEILRTQALARQRRTRPDGTLEDSIRAALWWARAERVGTAPCENAAPAVLGKTA
ncbi:hypothetical protein ACFYXM_13185 [Streptomyces sp. NPDC002476]|uniref:hypothetical protein n=1 Tax=Streptomyces sp. NPDC002476 TaxID=3364648 RepID=UPI0036B5EC2A